MAGAGRKVNNQVNMHRDGNGGLSVEEMLGEASQSDIFGLNYVDLLTRLQSDLVPTAGINGVPVDTGSSSIPDGSTLTYDAASGAYVQSAPTTQPYGFATGITNSIVDNTRTVITWTIADQLLSGGMTNATGNYFTVPEDGLYVMHLVVSLVSGFTPITHGFIQASIDWDPSGTSFPLSSSSYGTDVTPIVSGVDQDFLTTHATITVQLTKGTNVRASVLSQGSFGGNLGINGGYFWLTRTSA